MAVGLWPASTSLSRCSDYCADCCGASGSARESRTSCAGRSSFFLFLAQNENCWLLPAFPEIGHDPAHRQKWAPGDPHDSSHGRSPRHTELSTCAAYPHFYSINTAAPFRQFGGHVPKVHMIVPKVHCKECKCAIEFTHIRMGVRARLEKSLRSRSGKIVTIQQINHQNGLIY